MTKPDIISAHERGDVEWLSREISRLLPEGTGQRARFLKLGGATSLDAVAEAEKVLMPETHESLIGYNRECEVFNESACGPAAHLFEQQPEATNRAAALLWAVVDYKENQDGCS